MRSTVSIGNSKFRGSTKSSFKVPADNLSLRNINGNSENTQLLQKDEQQMTKFPVENSMQPAASSSIDKLDSHNLNNAVDKPQDLIDETPLLIETCIDMKPSNSFQLSHDSEIYDADAVAPIATLDTMHDLELASKLKHS